MDGAGRPRGLCACILSKKPSVPAGSAAFRLQTGPSSMEPEGTTHNKQNQTFLTQILNDNSRDREIHLRQMREIYNHNVSDRGQKVECCH